jgi:hypothetical protein
MESLRQRRTSSTNTLLGLEKVDNSTVLISAKSIGGGAILFLLGMVLQSRIGLFNNTTAEIANLKQKIQGIWELIKNVHYFQISRMKK